MEGGRDKRAEESEGRGNIKGNGFSESVLEEQGEGEAAFEDDASWQEYASLE